jgi:ABC-2 type transport system ATP-binding protein
MEEAQRLCNRLAIMDHGSIIALDTPSALIKEWGKEIIRIEFKDPIDKVQINQLQKLGTCQVINGRGNKLYLESKNTEQTLKELLEFTEKAKITLKTLDILEKNLESVFLHLTGRNLRD